jgi:hypothetical protein
MNACTSSPRKNAFEPALGRALRNHRRPFFQQVLQSERRKDAKGGRQSVSSCCAGHTCSLSRSRDFSTETGPPRPSSPIIRLLFLTFFLYFFFFLFFFFLTRDGTYLPLLSFSRSMRIFPSKRRLGLSRLCRHFEIKMILKGSSVRQRGCFAFEIGLPSDSVCTPTYCDPADVLI